MSLPLKSILLVLLLTSLTTSQADDSDILTPSDPSPSTPLASQSDSQSTTIPAQSEPSPSAKVRASFNFDLVTLVAYRYEVAAIVCVLVYLVAYRVGKAKNYDLMEGFYSKTRSFVDANFAHVGFTAVSGEEPFVGESPSEALFYASGRDNVDFLEIKFNMLKRQDLLYHIIYQTIYPEKDTIIIDIATSTPQPIVFCIANKRKLKHITENNIDIAQLAGSFDVKGLSSAFHALGECSDVLDNILDANTCKKLNQMASLIHSVHYSDQKFFSQSQGNLRAIFYASSKNVDKYQAGFELLFQIVDKIKNIKLSANEKARALKARQAFNASKEKEKLEKHNEQLRKKKEEKRKQEEAWLRSLPADKQKREDEKRKKKELNRFMKSRVMKVA